MQIGENTPAFQKRPRVAFLLLGMLFAAAAAARAQVSLEVLVLDQSTGRPVAGAPVGLQNAETGTNATATTSDLGKVRFTSLSTSGRYVVSVAETAGYYELKSDPVTLRSNFARSVTLSLAPRAQVTSEVAVTPGHSVAQINTVNAEVSASLPETELRALPVEGRDITRSLYRLPNVVQATGFYPEAPNVSINGANSLYSNYTLDGLDNNENFLGGQKFAVPLGFAQEVTALTNNYSTEFGRTANGVINVTTKSGGNAFHGELFYLTRPGPAIDASSAFAQRDLSGNQVKDGFQRQQGGGAIGGPILRDRTFFFVNAEYTRDTKDNLLNSPELGVNETVRGHNAFPYYSGRVDQRWTESFATAFRGNVGSVTIERQGGGLDGGVGFPSAGNFQDRDSALVAASTTYVARTFTSETNLQYGRFRWNYGRARNPTSPQVTVLDPREQAVAVLGNPGYVFDDLENTFQAQQKFAVTRGPHYVRAGVEILSSEFSLLGGGNVHGNYTVKLTDAQLAAVRALNRGTALSVTDIPGDAEVLSYNVELQPKSFGARQTITSAYADDQWSVGPRLTVNAGLRYDYDSLSRGGSDRGDTNNLAPRLSANYQIDDRSVVRGGFGVFYDKILYAIYSDALQQNSISNGFRGQINTLIGLGILPRSTDLDRIFFDGNVSASLRSGVSYLQGPSGADLRGQRESIISNDLRILNPNGYKNPWSEQFALGYQRQLSSAFAASLDLIYIRSHDLFRLRDLNAPAPYPINPDNVVVRTPAEADATRPAGVVAGGGRNIVVTESAGRARYQAATLTVLSNPGTQPYAFRFSYTLSSLKNETEDINFRAADSNDFAEEYGPSINDRTNVVNAVVSVFPLRGLTVSLAALFQSGQPINRIPDARIYGTTDLNGDGRSFGDAYVGNSDRNPGDSRNDDRLPWSELFDIGIRYQIPIGAGYVELAADVFNLFNHVNLSGYSNNATQSNQIQVGPTAGGIVEKNAGSPRQFQFGVRFAF